MSNDTIISPYWLKSYERANFFLHGKTQQKGQFAPSCKKESIIFVQNSGIKYLENIEQDHQIIFTTSVLSNDLNNSAYCVGPEYSFNLKTLYLS